MFPSFTLGISFIPSFLLSSYLNLIGLRRNLYNTKKNSDVTLRENANCGFKFFITYMFNNSAHPIEYLDKNDMSVFIFNENVKKPFQRVDNSKFPVSQTRKTLFRVSSAGFYLQYTRTV